MDENFDFTVTLISNGSEKYYSTNTLTQFINHLPNEITLDKSKDWFVSLHDIGLHLNYEVLPFPKETPVLITFDGNEVINNPHIAQKEFSDSSQPFTKVNIYQKIISNQLSGFELKKEELKIGSNLLTLDTLAGSINDFIENSKFLQDKFLFRISSNKFEYDPHQVIQDGNNINIRGLKDFAYNNPNIKQVTIRQVLFKNSFENRVADSKKRPLIGVCLHRFLFEAFDLSLIRTSLIEIEKQPYYLTFLKPKEVLLGNYFLEKNFPRLASNICHVHCDIIDPYNYNQNYCSILRTISLPRSNTYLYTTLKSLQYFRIKSDNIKDISIRLTNDKFENLPILPGVASIAKLKFKAMDKPKVSNLKVCSNSLSLSSFQNSNNNFKIKIPTNLNFNQPNLKMCVSSITFPNKFKTLPSSSLNEIKIFVPNLTNLEPKF